MFIYAQIDSDNKVFTVSNLAGEVVKDNLIPLPFFADDLLNSTFENGDFVKTVEEVKYKFNFDSKSWEAVA